MKKITSLLLLLFVLGVYSQERTHWQAYSFSIDGSEGIKSILLLNAIYESMVTGKEIKMELQLIYTVLCFLTQNLT